MRIIIAGVICLLASSLSASNLFDVVQSLREQAWESEYIPESTVPVVPLTDYDEFEVIELFRAETIEELEASLTDGYPYPWLEETLKDESIPWEDRYWLDCRMRAAISQNLHVFYDTENNPVHVEADGVFPGEFYWREHMIVDPEGSNVPEGTVRPTHSERTQHIDMGYLIDAYGYNVGKLNIAVKGIQLSRDASIGLIITGQTGEYYSAHEQYYACLLYPDGSFREFPFNEVGYSSGSISANGNILVFFRHSIPGDEASFVEVWDRDGNLLRRFPSEIDFEIMNVPPITYDGHHASCILLNPSAHSALVDCVNGEIRQVTEHTGTDISTTICNFSPDGRFFCIGGATKGRVIDLNNGSVYEFPETTVREDCYNATLVNCSNSRIVTTLTTRYSNRSNEDVEISLYVDNTKVYSQRIDIDSTRRILCTEVSPNGHYLLVNPGNNRFGSVQSIPLSVLNIAGR